MDAHLYLDPRFKVFQLVSAVYQPVTLEEGDLFVSQALGIPFRPAGPVLRVLDPLTRAPVPLFDEAARRAEAEGRRAEEETRRAREAIQRAEQLDEELRRLRGRKGDAGREAMASLHGCVSSGSLTRGQQKSRLLSVEGSTGAT